VKALIVANDFLEVQLDELRAKVSTGCARGRLDGRTQGRRASKRTIDETSTYDI
jgi:hypothetical protein